MGEMNKKAEVRMRQEFCRDIFNEFMTDENSVTYSPWVKELATQMIALGWKKELEEKVNG